MDKKRSENKNLSVPTQLRNDEFRFIKLVGKTKLPLEKDWQDKNNYAWNDPSLQKHISAGNNYGVLGGFGGLIGIDADEPPLIGDVKGKLPKTFTVGSPHGSGIHTYNTTKDDDIPSPVLFDLIEDKNGKRKNIGNIRGGKGFVVGPSCSVFDCKKCGAHDKNIEGRGRSMKCKLCRYEGDGVERFYEIIDDSPIAEVKISDVLTALSVYLKNQPTPKDYGNKEFAELVFTHQDVKGIMDVVKNAGDLTPQGGNMYRGRHPVPHPNDKSRDDYFVVNAENDTWYCHVDATGGSILQLIAVQEGIIRCEDCVKGALHGEQFKKVKGIAKEKYGITLKHEEPQQPPKSDIPLHDVEYYKRYDGTKRDGTPKYVGINYKLFADDLIAIYHFKTLRDTEQVLCYKDGYFQYNGEAIIKEKSEEIFGALISTHGVNEIIGHVQRSTHIDRDNVDANPTLLNFENGLYNIKTNEFTPHTPNHIITARIPVKYDPNADCPEIKQFLRDIVEIKEDAVLLEEILGFCLYRRYFIKKAIMLTGGGDNGKSIYLNLIEHFLGKENCSSIVLQRLTLKDRFTNAFLVGKLANIAGDLSSDALKDTGMFKMLTGGDYVPAEIKGGNIFKFLNSAKMLFSANEIPGTDDLTSAFWTRWVIIEFPFKFVDDPKLEYEKKKVAEELLLEKLTTPEEMSGFLNWALKRLKRLLEKRVFSYDKSTEEIEEEYRTLSSNIYGFVKEWCVTGSDKRISKTDLYNAYTLYCDWKKKYPETKNMLGRELPRIVAVEKIQPKIEGKQVEAWGGISLNEKFVAFIENNNGDNGNNGYFSYSKINQLKNSNITTWKKKGEKKPYSPYPHYENEQITPELLNNDFENLGSGECEGCHEQKGSLWSVKIGNKEAGFCIDCIKDTIEQEREKKEGDAEEAEKQEKEVKEKPTPTEIKKIILEVGKCKSCGKGEIDLIYVVHYPNDEFKNVCGDCGEQIMHKYGIKLSGGVHEQ